MPDHSNLKTTVVIASSLKSATDIRAWGKLGISMRETSKYRLNIIGFSAKKIQKLPDVNFYSSEARGHSRWFRLLAMLRFTRLLVAIRPKILICCTYDYLPIARALKKYLGYKLVYDVQENYVANLALNPNLTDQNRKRIGELIQKMEHPKGIDLYLLAESCYQIEMPEKTPSLVLENKFAGNIKHISPINYAKKEAFNFLISGTISPAYGTLEGIQWYQKIRKNYPTSSLHVIGHLPLISYQHSLQKLAENDPSITLELSETPVEFDDILAAYPQADFLLLPYQNHSAFQDKLPTKLFEAAALGIPVLISPNPTWNTFLERYNSGSAFNFCTTASTELEFKHLISQTYFSKTRDNSLLWSSQNSAFLNAIETLITEY